MKSKPNPTAQVPRTHRPTTDERRLRASEKEHQPMLAELRRRAEAQMRGLRRKEQTALRAQESAIDTPRVLHELQVHQIELELQNTELQQARDRLEAQLEKYTDLYDFAPVGYFSLDESGVILEVNLTGAALLGVERSRLLNRRLSLFVTAASQPVFQSFLKRVFAGTGNLDCEAQLLKEQAAAFWARLRGTSALSVSKARKWCRVAVSDITERKLAEAALRSSEVRLASVLEHLPVGVGLFDREGQMVLTNANMRRFIGESVPSFDRQRRHRWRAWAPDGSPLKFNQWPGQRALRGETVLPGVEFRFTEDDGRATWVSVAATPLRDTGGAVVMVEDIDQRKRAEEAIARLAAIVKSSEDAIISKNLDGLITTWNRGAERLFGYLEEEAVGQPLAMIFHHHHLVAGISKRIHKGELIGSFETVCRHKGGRSVDVSLTISAITDAQGRVVGMSKIMRDITEHKRAEAVQHRVEVLAASNQKLAAEIVRRQAGEKALKKSERHLSQSLAQSRQQQEQLRQLARKILQAQEEERKRISRELHDQVTQTLVGMNLHLESLAREGTINPRGLKRKIVDTQQLIEKSVAVVHRFARDLRPTLLDDLGLIPALHAYLKEFTERTKVRIHFKAFAGVERLSSDRCTVIYRVAQSALTNIAQHAHATDVKVSLEKIRNTARLEIHDNGKSFDVERVLFAKRYQRLGLIGTRERVEMIGGSFNVESAPGQGTTVRAQIPFSHDGKEAKARRCKSA